LPPHIENNLKEKNLAKLNDPWGVATFWSPLVIICRVSPIIFPKLQPPPLAHNYNYI